MKSRRQIGKECVQMQPGPSNEEAGFFLFPALFVRIAQTAASQWLALWAFN